MTSWEEGGSFELKAPILNFTIEDALDDSFRARIATESPDAPECFPKDKKTPPLSYQVNRTCHRAIGLGPAFSLHGHILRETKCELKL